MQDALGIAHRHGGFRWHHRRLAPLWGAFFLSLTALTLGDAHGAVAPAPRADAPPQAPPPTPPPVTNASPAGAAAIAPRSATAGQVLWSIGDPTDEEQYYLELINRARAHPPAEGVRLRNLTDPDIVSAYTYFSVDLNLLVQQFSTIAPAPPLAMNSRLLASARLHSSDQLANNFQGHYGTDGSSPGTRITSQGYTWTTYGENVYAYSKSVEQGHAGFEVDWGGTVGGMQSPPGHRNNIHSAAFREVGIGMACGSNGTVGPQVVTQDFSARSGQSPFVTGVVYYDFNTNGAYDPGEGLPGVQVDVGGSSYYAVTANSGGYAVPVPGNGNYTVTFTARGLPGFEQTVSVSNNQNVKVDYTPDYEAPAISGPNPAMVGQDNVYAITGVGAALGYQWQYSRIVPAAWVEGAENGSNRVIISSSGTYAVIDPTTRASGNASFHLAHPQPADQVVLLDRVIRPSARSQLTLASRLGWASAAQVARLQVTADGGLSWTDLFTRAGTGNSGQADFVRTTHSLAAFAGREIQVRFVYDHIGGSYYYQTSAGVGFYFDDVSISDAEELVEPVTSPITAEPTFHFRPTETNPYGLRARAEVGDRLLDWGPLAIVQASTDRPPAVRFTGPPLLADNRAQLDFVVLQGTPSIFQVESAPAPEGPWSTDTSATIQRISEAHYRASAAAAGATACYRLRMQ